MVDNIWKKINSAYDNLDDPTHLMVSNYDYDSIVGELQSKYGTSITSRDVEEEFGIKLIVSEFSSQFTLFKEVR